jgi:opacity protein-like surface antigen
MKKLTLLAIALIFGWLSVAQAQDWVGPYTRRDGTQVQGYYRSSPDSNPYNNYSYPGNVNPYTGKQATGDPNRYLERYNNEDHSGSGSNSKGSVYNPFTIYRK